MFPRDNINEEQNLTTKQETTTTSTSHDHYAINNLCKPSSSSKATTASWTRLKDPRIVRVSRALGGKDRHSKVCTVRGLRDRRVRLSVPTAIQLYDLQDRLGLNQPSKVVDWLLNAAKHEIDELPPLQFPQGSLISQNLHPMMSFQDFTAKQGLSINSMSTDQMSDRGNEDHERQFLENNQGDQLNNFLSVNNPSFLNSAATNYNSFVRWDSSNLTLNHHHHHPSISLGLTAQNDHHHQDLHNFGLVYHQPEISTQPNFPRTNTDFNPKGRDFQTSSSEMSNSIRPFQFSMTANLMPSQNNVMNEENKHDELNSS